MKNHFDNTVEKDSTLK
jgi:hypothetical protein